MAMQQHNNRIQRYRRPQQGLLNPDNIRRAANLAGHVGRAARRAYDNWNNDIDEHEEYTPPNTPAAHMESAPVNIPIEPANVAKGGVSNAGIGYRGSLTGNTQLHESYGTHYHEIQELHSKKIKHYNFIWAFKTKVTADDSTTPLYPGQFSGPSFAIWSPAQLGLSPFQNQLNRANFSCVDLLYSQALNWTLDDFIDNKLLSNDGTSGLMTQYLRFRLKSFTIHITPCTFNGGVSKIDPEDFIEEIAPNTSGQVDKFTSNLVTSWQPFQKLPTDYWVLRDVYNDYTDSVDPFTIPNAPPETNSGGILDRYSRACRTIRNFDTYLTVMNDESGFSFTRHVATKANYYLTRNQIQTLRNQNIQVLINALEGLDGANGIASALPESFNLLFVPTHAPVSVLPSNLSAPQSFGQITGPAMYCNINTQLYVKCQSTWEAYDFNYTTQQGPLSREMDLSLMTSVDTMKSRIIERHTATACVQLEDKE